MPITNAAYSIQRLGAADLSRMRTLLRVFGDAFDDVATYHDAQPSDAYLASLLAKEHFIAVAALAGDEVVGGLAAYVLDKFEQERREIYIYDLAVVAAHRRRHLATRLIEALRAIAAEIGAYVIFVQADLTDAPAIALYASVGTIETAHHFDIAIERTH